VGSAGLGDGEAGPADEATRRSVVKVCIQCWATGLGNQCVAETNLTVELRPAQIAAIEATWLMVFSVGTQLASVDSVEALMQSFSSGRLGNDGAGAPGKDALSLRKKEERENSGPSR